MSEKKNKGLLIVGGVLLVILFLLFWKRPETAKQLFEQITDPGTIAFPDAQGTNFNEYGPSVFEINVPGYTSSGPGNAFTPQAKGCSLCSTPYSITNIFLPATEEKLIEKVAASTTPKAVQQNMGYASASIQAPPKSFSNWSAPMNSGRGVTMPLMLWGV